MTDGSAEAPPTQNLKWSRRVASPIEEGMVRPTLKWLRNRSRLDYSRLVASCLPKIDGKYAITHDRMKATFRGQSSLSVAGIPTAATCSKSSRRRPDAVNTWQDTGTGHSLG